MNSKKTKHKNRPHKSPNRIPPQKLDIKSDEVIEELQEESALKDNDRVPEIVSEIVTPSVIELQKLEADSPKKPKRNKGKKNKKDKDETAGDNIEEKVSEPRNDEINIDNESEKRGTDTPTVVPTIRKKKIKKKPQGIPIEESNLPQNENLCETNNAGEATNKEKIELIPPQTESKLLKKKIKKKKQRNDSEKSEDNVCCTKAFQVLLEVEDKISDRNESEKTEDVQITEKQSDTSKSSVFEEKFKTNIEVCTGNIEEIISEVAAEEKSACENPQTKKTNDDEKSKKKQKKGKKHLTKELLEDETLIEHKDKVEDNIADNSAVNITSGVSAENVFLDEVKQHIKLEETLESSETDPYLNLIAKNAKPEEQKSKTQLEIEHVEVSPQVISSIETVVAEEKSTTNNMFETIEIQDASSKEKPVTGCSTDMNKPDDVTEENVLLPNLQYHEYLNAPYPIMGKKKKRLPKAPKEIESKFERKEFTQKINVESDTMQSVEDVSVEKMLPMEQESILPIQSTTDNIPNIVSKSTLSTTIDSKVLEKVELFPDNQQQHQDPIVGSENKTRRKKNKLPLQTHDKTEGEKIMTKDIESEVSVTHATNKQSEQAFKKESNILVDMNIVDIEISSVKADESEGPRCEVTPDIHYPRARSQQLIDDNNNMAIQEIAGVEELRSNISLIVSDPPNVQGSGETPITTPEFVASGIRVTEIKTKVPEGNERKTDLKSKMMEVNQDMEELRLSIERSLAEFTAMENNEKESEKNLEEVQLKSGEKGETQLTKTEEKTIEVPKTMSELIETKIGSGEQPTESTNPPICPARREHKGKGKCKKKGKLETVNPTPQNTSDGKNSPKDDNKEEKAEKTEQKSESTTEKGKQQSCIVLDNDANTSSTDLFTDTQDQFNFEPIDNFEDALTSSVDDVNKTFDMIANEVDSANDEFQQQLAVNKPQINVTAPVEDTADIKGKENPVSPPKNLLGHPDIPVSSNKTDYKKEKNKTPNTKQAKVKLKDAVDIETSKQSKESQTENKIVKKDHINVIKEPFDHVTNDNEEFVYKYSFRKVFLQSSCHVCKKDLYQVRVPCNFCNLVFYCSTKHKDEDWPLHQALCFAVSTIVHLKDQKHIYSDAKNVTGHNYRLIRMQMIVSCEKVLKRRLVPWEQESLLYPRICVDAACREWRQSKLKDCENCGQISYCSSNPEHLPKSHQRWCKSYFLYQKLVSYQQTKGRLEPKLPSRVMMEEYQIPEKINEVFASMYEEKIDMNELQYAALTQLATAPLTAAYCHQIYINKMNCTQTNGLYKKTSFVIHVVGAELQFEADTLNKWEVFFLHLRPGLKDLRVVLISSALNPSNLPLDLLGKIKLCENCLQNKRRVVFDFQDKKSYLEYRSSEEFSNPDIVCTFNASLQRSSICNGKDPWPSTINSILKLKTPFVITSSTMTELRTDLHKIDECAEVEYKVISEPNNNNFASVRPDRNFISDDEMPLLYKNYCFAIICGA